MDHFAGVDAVLDAYGFPVCRNRLVKAREELTEAADAVGYPLVLKAFGNEIVHKSDLGGVIIGIENSDELLAAYEQMDKSLGRFR